MANNAYETGDYVKAEKCFKKTMKTLLSDGYHQSDKAIIHISAKLASLYASCGDRDAEAEAGFKFCFENLEDEMTKNLKNGLTDDRDAEALYCLTLSSYGEFQYKKGDIVQSLDLFRRCHDMSVKINGPHHPYSLQQLNAMAASYSRLNRLDEAVDCLKSAINLAQTELEQDQVADDLPFYHINLVNVYLTQLNNPSADSGEILKSASQSCGTALELARKIGSKEALVEAEKCMATIKQHLQEPSR